MAVWVTLSRSAHTLRRRDRRKASTPLPSQKVREARGLQPAVKAWTQEPPEVLGRGEKLHVLIVVGDSPRQAV